MSQKMPLSICQSLATNPPQGKITSAAIERSGGILIERLPGAATGLQTVTGVMAVMTEMADQCLVCSEECQEGCLMFSLP